MRNMILTVIVMVLGMLALWEGTDGFHAFTSEGARRYAVENHSPQLPNITLRDQYDQTFSLSSMQGKYVLFTFFYTRCEDLCPILETQFAKVVAEIPESLQGKDVEFLSISFDPAHDDALAMQDYAKMLHADGVNWRIVTVPDKSQLAALLKLCGVVVIPDNQGGFEHNAAIYSMDRQSRLTHIYNFQKPELVVRNILPLLGT